MNILAIIWAAVGALMTASEIFIPGFTIFFFGIGGFVTALFAFLFPAVALPFQVLVWVGSSSLLLGFLRKKFTKTFKGELIEEDSKTYTGQKAKVVERISPEKSGRIKFKGTTWTATSYNEIIEVGETVEILEKAEEETLSFLVTKSILD